MKGNFWHESSTVYMYITYEFVFADAVCSQSLSAKQVSACIHKAHVHTEGTLDASRLIIILYTKPDQAKILNGTTAELDLHPSELLPCFYPSLPDGNSCARGRQVQGQHIDHGLTRFQCRKIIW